MNLYNEQFSSTHDFPLVDKPSKILIIASTGRCGSHMLGHSLYESGYFGFPLEYANPSNIVEWKNRFGVNDFFQVLKKIQERRTSSNGVFSIKIHYPHIKLFGEFKQLVDFFPNAYFILLSRENVLRQAVSLSIARQTGVWISGQIPVDDNPKYDFIEIDKCLKETINNNSSWRYKLAASGCNYIEMSFENICKDLSKSINNIADFMDINIDLNNLPQEHATKKQSSDKKKEWTKKFISEHNLNQELIQDSKKSHLYNFKQKINLKFKSFQNRFTS